MKAALRELVRNLELCICMYSYTYVEHAVRTHGTNFAMSYPVVLSRLSKPRSGRFLTSIAGRRSAWTDSVRGQKQLTISKALSFLLSTRSLAQTLIYFLLLLLSFLSRCLSACRYVCESTSTSERTNRSRAREAERVGLPRPLHSYDTQQTAEWRNGWGWL